ncbi:MAG: hypothetical protein KR126chlam1_01260 [Chlamydiae bacterium]|nr:hypothetical protein [Chlamydiota bacterium]
MNCFYRREPRFSPLKSLWRAEQTRGEFVELEELFIGEKKALIGGEMNLLTYS